jgi:stress-induced morphogen
MALSRLRASLAPRLARLPQTSSSYGASPLARLAGRSQRPSPARCGVRGYADVAPDAAPPDYLDDKERAIFSTLRESLNPTALEVCLPATFSLALGLEGRVWTRRVVLTRLQVQDVSGGCGSMYAINVTSEKFRGLSMIKQHRLVNEILGEEIKKWHGLQLRTKIPQ